MKINNVILGISSFILIIISVILGFRVYEVHGVVELFHSNRAVSVSTWLPLVISLMLLGAIIRYYTNNSIVKYTLLLWPLVHLLIVVILVPIFRIMTLTPPFGFLGELLACGYILASLIEFKYVRNRKKIAVMVSSLIINGLIIYYWIIAISKAHTGLF